MDFGFNNIAPSRDPGPGPAPGKTGVADMGFADILGATLNASEEARPPQPSNIDKYTEATPEPVDPASPPREAAPPAKHDAKESQPHKPDGTKTGQAEEPSTSPVAEAPAHELEESQAAPAEQSKPAPQKTETQAETTQNVAAAAPASSTPSTPAPVVVAQIASVVVPENSATPQQGAPATAPAAPAAPPATAQPAATDVPVVPQTQPVSDSAASAPDFGAHLQAAAGQIADSAGESPAAPTPSTPDKTAPAASSAMPKLDPAASQNNHQEAAAPAQAPSPAPAPVPTPTPQTTAPAVPAAQVVAAQTSPNPVPADTAKTVKTPAADAAPDVAADDGDAAPIIAFTRSQTMPSGESTTQAAAADATRRVAANDAAGAQAGKDAFDPARTTTMPEKTEAASRPLGPLAPATGLAAQATAQDAASGAAQPQAAASTETQVKADTERTAANTGAEAPKIDLASANAKADAAMAAELQAIRTNAVDAPAAAARAGRALPHSVVAQIAPHIAQAAADGNDRINIRLSPADLGRVEVKLEFGPDGRVQAVFAADRPQTVDLLQRDARDLERALQDAGLRADSGSLSFNLRGENREQPQRFGEAPTSKRADDLPAETPPQYHRPYASASAASGRLDIRV